MEINLAAYLNNAAKLREISVSDLNSLIKRYPYCSLVYIVLAKKLYIDNSNNYLEAIKKAALYASSIEALELYMQKDSRQASTVPIKYTSIALNNKSVAKANLSNAEKKNIDTEQPNFDILDTPKGVTTILSENNSVGFNVCDKETVHSAAANQGQSNSLNAIDYSNRQLMVSDSSLEATNTRRLFIDWLGLSEYSRYENKNSYTSRLIKHKIKVSELEGINLIKSDGEEEIEIEFDAENQQDIIIGDFVKTDPKVISYDKNDNLASLESIRIDTSCDSLQVVSENLIDIYLEQALYKEAIDMCKKLIANKPDKELYYNKKIEGIKNLMVKIR